MSLTDRYIKSLRAMHGFTLADVCELLDGIGYEISPPQLSRYEKGNVTPPEAFLAAFCQAFNVKPPTKSRGSRAEF